MDQFSDLLSTYYRNPNASNYKAIQEHLWDDFIASISGIRKLRCTISKQSFLFIYPDGCHKSKIATLILWNNIEKDFSELIKFGFEELLSKAKEKRLDATLTGTERTRWFRATAAIVLTNKVYAKELSRFKTAKTKASRTLWQDLSNLNVALTLPNQLVNTIGLYGAEAAQLAFEVMSDPGHFTVDDSKAEEKIRKAASVLASFNTYESDHVQYDLSCDSYSDEDKSSRLTDEQSFAVYCQKINNNQIEMLKILIDQQNQCLFGNQIEPYTFIQTDDQKTICVGFFYSWLRKCSGASYTEIAAESKVSVSAVTRDWKPEDTLLQFFPDGSFHADYGIYPVSLSSAMRGHIGLFEKVIRNNKAYRVDKGNHQVYVSKCLLWDIYLFIMAQGQLDCSGFQIQDIGTANQWNTALRNEFEYEIVSNRELGIHEDKRYMLVYIKDLKNVK
jgi:hypothetical protein